MMSKLTKRNGHLEQRSAVWLHVLLYTGLRRGDAVVLGKQHVKDGVATLKTEKTGTEVNIPILPDLAVTLKVGPIGDLAFIVGRLRSSADQRDVRQYVPCRMQQSWRQ